MFELSVAWKYLTPRWRQLSVSIISMVSILVIALVVWLIVVFFSVTYGLEKSWIQKLTTLTAPVRILPTEAYYNSYYYQVDGISGSSDYTLKNIHEKRQATLTDPHDSTLDEEPPQTWGVALRNPDGSLVDLVKKAVSITEALPFSGLTVNDFEMTVGNLHLNLVHAPKSGKAPTALNQATYLGNIDDTNPSLEKVIVPLSADDQHNLDYALASTVGKQSWLSTETAPTLAASFITDASGRKTFVLPSKSVLGSAVILPKGFRDAGVLAGDRGYVAYHAATASSVQEQRLPVYVAGFYDPGIIPIGGKFVLASADLINTIRNPLQRDNFLSNGINVRFANIDDADKVKTALQNAFQAAGIAPYWHVETYREFEFTKDLIQQLRSEKNLWTLLATVIIIVACSNIISMLIILVNDKKMEIGILRAMGASSGSIAAIFGICGMVMGAIGSFIGTLAAFITLLNLQTLVDFIGRMQGYEMFNPIFYGNSLPNEVSMEALMFVVITTSLISLVAGVVPAVKACLLRPSTILKAE